ncbi:helix-turn-helix transcriptional regulator [Serratia marcescens]|uniref:helix-turn-helix transcriptional regulator n=1 Tax=Serratia TaxID=613 RepID=UPI0011F113A5|nr:MULTISPECIES: LuxR C-terminal-related transcriptional regulator [Serratia]ELQ9310753.1 helix-turn-helix transcriptional regulator [Serratia marcescens]ELQ9440556.1 helix-turn-helix transcriptional regulator [Serratia marcescens]ELT5561996.1 helix-turn-helix transcriptional regulator [Serratia marcescens]MBH2585580.1 helix-turn-helix transcriptional regulator [Serratia marcescens]MBH2729084.1 helix-turn-helix transcriptional regulator [Serratia marcescens]
MKSVNILIDDENRYFAAGLQHGIMEYAQVNHKTVRFLTPENAGCADVVFASPGRRAQRWRRAGQPVAQVVTIKAARSAVANDTSGVLYRSDRQGELCRLLTRIFAGEAICILEPTLPLTPRERQVIGYLRRGLGQSQTARMMGVSVKTVHSHKRSIMGKLLLKRQHDFIYWLLSQKEEYS